jgi:hypothetical protein
MVKFLCIGESLLMDMWPLLMMRNCLKVLVASHLLLFLKVGEQYIRVCKLCLCVQVQQTMTIYDLKG